MVARVSDVLTQNSLENRVAGFETAGFEQGLVGEVTEEGLRSLCRTSECETERRKFASLDVDVAAVVGELAIDKLAIDENTVVNCDRLVSDGPVFVEHLCLSVGDRTPTVAGAVGESIPGGEGISSISERFA